MEHQESKALLASVVSAEHQAQVAQVEFRDSVACLVFQACQALVAQ
jgi:hypothetical protein